MKHADQNKMDLLLRSFARRNPGAASAQATGDDAFSAHLDADELNAFAEGVLPERARGRYSEHLADCAKCRGVVIKLTQAADIPEQRQTVEEQSVATFWDRIKLVFSQPVLRYALPAIVLFSVLGVGLLSLRQDGPDEFIAQHQPSPQPPNMDQSHQTVPSESPSQIGAMSRVAPTPSTGNASVPVETPKGESGSRTSGTTPPAVAGLTRTEADAQAAQAPPPFAPDLNAPAAPPSLPAYAARDRAGTLAKEDMDKRESERAQVAAEAKVETSDAVDDRDNSAAAKASGSSSKPGNFQGLMTERRDKNKKDSTDRAESRTVSGKRFVRHKDSWVDSAYESSSTTTNVKRGSEQYRALVADEPGIRSFAEQLSGEVIVVWKGRAYRIH
jgi:hypothetical protein